MARPLASISALSASILPSWLGMKRWPPKPGLTLITSTRSMSPRTGSTAWTGVAGLSATPARLPVLLMRWSVRFKWAPASTWTVMLSAPASANGSI